MFAIERIKIIKNHLIEDQRVSVAKLSELLDVTEMTIRRDLVKLEKEGFLKRTHGGAVILDYITEEILETPKDDETLERCEEIAETAFHLVSDYDTIMVMEGFVNLQIAKKLTNRNNLTVITNDLRVASEFTNSPNNNHLIMLGGDLDTYGVYGQLAVDNMRNFAFTHLFIEADGIDTNIGVTVSSISKATLMQQALPLSETMNLVCLSNHFGNKALYRVGQLKDADNILTDSSLKDAYKDYLFQHNLRLYTSVNAFEKQ